MTQVLRQSTAVDILIGPFLDLTDGKTAETGESPSVKLSKNGQTMAAKNDATTPVHDADGYYNCEFDATDTNTIGTLVVTVAASATALPVRHEIQVIEEAAYDAIYASSASPATAGALTTVDTVVDAIKAVTDLLPNGGALSDLAAILADTAVIGAAGAGLTAIPWNASWDAQVESEVTDALTAAGILLDSGTMQAGATGSTAVLKVGGVSADDEWVESLVVITGGTGVGQARRIWDSTTVDDTVNIEPDWSTNPDATSTYTILSGARVSLMLGAMLGIADTVWDEDIVAAHGTADTAGLLLRALGAVISQRTNNATLEAMIGLADSPGVTMTGSHQNIEADTQDIQSRIPAALVGGRVDASVGAMAANVMTAAALAADAGTEIANALLDLTDGVETGITMREVQRVVLAALAGKADGLAGTTVHFRDQADGKNRITATVDANGNRTAITLDLT
jgi:hypothetical protein